jgi:hypothetical protein
VQWVVVMFLVGDGHLLFGFKLFMELGQAYLGEIGNSLFLCKEPVLP